MKQIFEIDIAKKLELTKILEDDPYGEKKTGEEEHMSFSRLGYKLKDGVTIGEDEKKIFLLLRGSDDYLPFVKKYLGDLAKRCSQEVENRIIAKIEEEESSAEQGMGSIFGD
ncbi:MAG: hypothetical protein WC492_02695 [Candidatus Micrarchaeia archaeon]